ncbi:hypothetical protein THAOC_22546 [Thalassiosira oceanica]|uniref:Uncharacterized protein n=1 Tax=Thalassiosira oceanica TaxID=159749 RepID=K0S909_THAOC|nr:hypothetical protein THAOC_22546 [Thalassiosira oceanica]|eukprot:EJK57411.1 hypothetical protein THAOC_22546 [Thalassiosira oceanica]
MGNPVARSSALGTARLRHVPLIALPEGRAERIAIAKKREAGAGAGGSSGLTVAFNEVWCYGQTDNKTRGA